MRVMRRQLQVQGRIAVDLDIPPKRRQTPPRKPRDQGAKLCPSGPQQDCQPKPEGQNRGRKARIAVKLKQGVARLHIVWPLHGKAGHKLADDGKRQPGVKQPGRPVVPGFRKDVRIAGHAGWFQLCGPVIRPIRTV